MPYGALVRGFSSRLPVIRALAIGVGLLAVPQVALAQNGTITGTVTNQATGAPLAGVQVTACTATQSCTSTVTNGSGVYAISRPPGPNYAFTAATAGTFVNETYNDVPCSYNCASEFALGSTIVVVSNATASQRDFALAPAGHVTGRVTDAATGAPLAGVSVVARRRTSSPNEGFGGAATTDASGLYDIGGLAAGRYLVSTFNTAGYADEFLGDVPCVAICQYVTTPVGTTPVDVVAGATAAGRDFGLALGGSISGRMTNRSTGVPVANLVAIAYTSLDGAALRAGTAQTDAAGNYTILGLAPGTYGVSTIGAQSIAYVDEIYDNLQCLGGCQPEAVIGSGNPIHVGSGTATAGIDFALDRAGAIRGTVTDASNGLPMPQVFMRFYRQEGTRLTYEGGGVTFPDGTYFLPLPPGRYFVVTDSDLAINETYPNVPCPRPCVAPDTALGQALVVTEDVTLSGRDFQLDRGGRVSGTVTDAAGVPVQNITVRIYRQDGATVSLVHDVQTGPTYENNGAGATGTYIIGGLAAGTYYLLATDQRFGHVFIDELYGGQQCPACSGTDLTGGSPIVLSATGTATGRNVALDVGLNISGTVRDGTGTLPLFGVTVNAYSTGSPSRPVATTVSRADGRYVLPGLPGGPHVVSTSGPSQYVHEVFNNTPCPGGICTGAFSAANGVVLSQPAGNSLFNVNFTLAPRTEPPGPPTGLTASALNNTVQISWTPPAGGTPATSYLVEAGLAPGTTLATLPVSAPTLTVPGVSPGVYFLRVRALNAYGTGAASTEYTLVVLGNGATAPVPPDGFLAWAVGSRLTMTWVDPPTGPRPTSYRVEAGTASGAANVGVLDVATRNFAFEAVPPGFYFVRVRAQFAGLFSAPTAETMLVVGGVPSPPGAPQNFATLVTGASVSFAWTAPALGAPTSYVLEAGTGPGLANLAVFDTGNPATALAVPAVPAGTYYVRLRARNAFGVSVTSAERIVTVP